MPIDANVSGPRIPSYMGLEQAMGEVRGYLNAKKQPPSVQVEGSDFAQMQLSLQGAFIARLSDIATRLGWVEPNSKLGAPGVFLKRVVRKLIGWYSRPAQEFDRTALENFQQIREDMLRLQQQISGLHEKFALAIASKPVEPSTLSAADFESRQGEPLQTMAALFKDVVALRAVRLALEEENPELLRKVRRLLDQVENDSGDKSQVRTPGRN